MNIGSESGIVGSHGYEHSNDDRANIMRPKAVPSGPTSVGQFVISLDFELYWGVHDNKTVDGYRDALCGARKAVPAMLDLFERYDIEATWATVGLLFFDDAKEAAAHLPRTRPAYANPKLDSFKVLENLGSDPMMDEFLFAKDLIAEINRRRGQEVGTHTFCHYYCWDDGDDAEAFDGDLAAALAAAARLGIEVKSLVFPRNQVKASYLPICQKHGITSYRRHPQLRREDVKGSRWIRQVKRVRRIADSFVQTEPSNLQPAHQESDAPVGIVGSRFLRTDAVRSPILATMHKRRIKNEMTKAAEEGGIFHLWWHPHNFGARMDAKLALLDEILDYFQEIRGQYGMVSANMKTVAGQCMSMVGSRETKAYAAS